MNRPDLDQVAVSLLAERFAYREPYARHDPSEDTDAACAERARELLKAVG